MNRSKQNLYFPGININESFETNNVKGTNELVETNGFSNSSSSTGSRSGSPNSNFSPPIKQGGMFGSVLLGQPTFNNPNNNFHNNIGDRILLEQTFDNKIFIDTSFKDFNKHPDPFKFTVKFNGTFPKVEIVNLNVNNDFYIYKKYIDGDSDIIFDRIFKNVKSVNVNALILPNCIEFKTDANGSYVPTDTKLAKSLYKYLILKIDELRNGRCFSNNNSLGREYFIMKKDDDCSHNNQIWIPLYKNVGYFESQLKTVDKLNVEICDDKGNKLFTKLDGKIHDFFTEYKKLIDVTNQLKIIGATPDIEKLIPRLNSLKIITNYLTPELHITFNTLEPQIDTKPQFRY